jgi:N-acetylmuramoyl-L-alanine amidase
MPAGSAQSPQLVVELVPSDRDEFLAAARADQLAGKTGSMPARPADKPNGASSGDPRPVVVLDPGHGGIDRGASAGGLSEKDVTLAFAQLLSGKLEAAGRYHVELTRNDDSYVRLGDRVEFARKERAQLFIAIHADSFRGVVRGATVYTLSRHASGAIAASIAAVENSSDILAGLDTTEEGSGDVADILADLARRETMSFSFIFARALVSDLRPITLLVKNPYQQAGFVVLRAPDVPSVLLELGYLSNPGDRKLLRSPEWQEHMATAVAKAIDDYFDTRAKGAAGQR